MGLSRMQLAKLGLMVGLGASSLMGAAQAAVVEGQDLKNCCPVCMDLASIQCRADQAKAWAQFVPPNAKPGKVEAVKAEQ